MNKTNYRKTFLPPILLALFLGAAGLLIGVTLAHGATADVFYGGDPGDGLDLQGNFVYAINVGPSGAAGKAGDADFTADSVPGVTITHTTGNAIGDWNPSAEFGDSAADDVLETMIHSIRWSDAANPEVPAITVSLTGIEVGARYKLQLLFGEGCCPQRGFDVFLNGQLIVDEFNPGGLQGGSNTPELAAYVSEEFQADTAVVEIVLNGRSVTTPEFTDHNAILNGLTLEKLSTASDTDGDGLGDIWEQQEFGNLNQTGTADPDNDGLNNAGEFAKATDPNESDTDGDGLSDGAEVNTHKTDPLKTDTDGDGLSDGDEVNINKTDPTKGDTDGDSLNDGFEVNVTLTDPAKADTDADGTNDYDELRLLTDPLNNASAPKNTLIARFTGGDAGEGLDLDGEFVYAIHLGTEESAGQVRDAFFTPDSVDGSTVLAQNTAAGWHGNVNLGDSPNDAVLNIFMPNIRWSDANNAAQPNVSVELANLSVGAVYKLQLIAAEACCQRAFDVFVEGQQIADDFSPLVYQGGMVTNAGAVLTHTFVARDTVLNLLADGRGVTLPGFTDHNAIIQAVTLERIAAGADSDNDSLPDAWENDVFGNLTQTAAGDPDGDQLTNAEEFTNYTDPNKADTDNDGLNDSEEVKTNKTNASRADTDGDGLKDGEEVKTHRTDPLDADTDDDGLNDKAEVAAGSNPADPPSQFSNVRVEMITGGDPGEAMDMTGNPTPGVDLQGNFIYAVNVSTAGPAGKAFDADFTAEDVAGVTITAVNNVANWDLPEYGDSAADDVIEKVLQSIRYAPIVAVRLTGLFPGSTYKMQMFFYEQCCGNRGFNIYADGTLITEDFVPAEVQQGVNNTAAGAMVSFEIAAKRDSLYVVLDAAAAPREDLTDPNAILDGFTLEALTLVAPPTLNLTKGANGQVTISTDATLQEAEKVNGPYTSLPNKSITVDPRTAPSPRFYRSTR
ncbi:MAG: binary toxin-like calcium binding domain-containing protein [Verrucomicrobiia bacterium]